jgi:Trk-type K+ transport system membrane component
VLLEVLKLRGAPPINISAINNKAVGVLIFPISILLKPAVLALFQSVTTRTAGFNSIDMGNIKTPTALLLMALMPYQYY